MMARQGTISVPPRAGPRGYFAVPGTEEQEIRESVEQVVFVNPGERFMRNDIGVPLQSFVFDPIDEIFEAMIEGYVRAQITRWEHRVSVTRVVAAREEMDDGSMAVSLYVDYTIISTGRTDSTKVNSTFIRAAQ